MGGISPRGFGGGNNEEKTPPRENKTPLREKGGQRDFGGGERVPPHKGGRGPRHKKDCCCGEGPSCGGEGGSSQHTRRRARVLFTRQGERLDHHNNIRSSSRGPPHQPRVRRCILTTSPHTCRGIRRRHNNFTTQSGGQGG